MRIAMICEPAAPAVGELARALSGRGHDVRTYEREPASDPLARLGAFGRDLAYGWQRGDWAPDVVHAHFWTSGLAAMTARARFPVPVVQTFHGLGADDPRIGYERVLGRRVDRVIAQSPAEADALSSRGVPRHAVRVVAPGVDITRFSPLEPGAHPDAPSGSGRRLAPPVGTRGRILSIGDLGAPQRYTDLVEALARLPDAELVIIGGPPPGELDRHPVAQRVRRFAHAKGLTDRVRLTGAVPREELPGWYRSCHVLACACGGAHCGRAALEAMACGVPVVGYATGDCADIVVDQVTGMLARPGDRMGLLRALRVLLTDRLRHLEYAAASVDRAQERYSWQRTVDQLVAVYEHLPTG